MGALLSFRLFNIPVAIHPSFLLIALVIGWINRVEDWRLMIVWVAIVFVSVLVHELGHALTARAFGASVEMELNGLGGLTRWGLPEGELPPGRRAVVAAAGSAAGFLLGGLAWVLYETFGPVSEPLVRSGVQILIFVNIFWGLLNWLPIRPLDGGHLVLSLLDKVAPNRGETIARALFTVTAAAGLVYAINNGLFFIAILAGWMLLGEFNSGRPRTPAAPIPEFGYDDEDEGPSEPNPGDWYGSGTADEPGDR